MMIREWRSVHFVLWPQGAFVTVRRVARGAVARRKRTTSYQYAPFLRHVGGGGVHRDAHEPDAQLQVLRHVIDEDAGWLRFRELDEFARRGSVA